MNFPIVGQYAVDLTGTDPNNFIRGEPVSFSPSVDDNSRIIAPAHAPFFAAKDLALFFNNGRQMELDVDYRIYSIMAKLTSLTPNEPVACFIEILNNNINDCLIDYRTVGDVAVIDQSILNMIVSAVNDDRPVWWKWIENKPVVFDPQLHKHSLVYEVVCFGDFVEFLRSLFQIINDKPNYSIEELKHYVDLVEHYMHMYGDMLTDLINHHKEADNSHGLTAGQIGLDLVDNFKTASRSQATEDRDDLHLTPRVLEAVIEEFSMGLGEFLETNKTPISQYGNTNFLPPSIAGSFEATGLRLNNTAITLEGDGSIVMLGERFDGRVEGLYFSQALPRRPGVYDRFEYTGHKYTHPFLTANNFNPNFVMQGSGADVMVVGRMGDTSNIFYVCLTNGTLDPSKHVYSKVDLNLVIGAIRTDPTSMALGDRWNYLSCCLIGDFIYIFHAHNYTSLDTTSYMLGDQGIRHIFRIHVGSIGVSEFVTASRYRVTFDDIHNVRYTNTYNWVLATPLYTDLGNGSYNITRSVNYFAQNPENGPGFTYYPFYYKSNTFCTKHPTKANVWVVKFTVGEYSRKAVNSANVESYSTNEIVYEISPSSSTWVKVNGTIPITINYETGNVVPAVSHARQLANAAPGVGAAVLPDGSLCVSTSTSRGSIRGFVVYKHKPTAFETMSTIWQTNSPTGQSLTETFYHPLANGSGLSSHAFNKDGEFFIARGPNNATDITSKLFFRAVTGAFAIRPAVSHIEIANLRSRPLTTDVKEVNLNPMVGMASISSSLTKLNAYGVQCGDSEFCTGITSNGYLTTDYGPYPTPPVVGEILLYAGHTRELNTDGKLNIVPTSEILYRTAIINQLRGLVEDTAGLAASARVYVTITDPNGGLTARFGYLPCIATISYSVALNSARKVTTVMFDATYTTSGIRRTVSSITVRDIKHDTADRQGYNYNNIDEFGDYIRPPSYTSLINRTRTQIYINDDDSLSISLEPGAYHRAGGSYVAYIVSAKINRTSKTFLSHSVASRTTSESSIGMAPGVPPKILEPNSTTGGGAMILTSDNNVSYVLASIYPPVGWDVYFNSEQPVVFNGKKYTLPVGNIDLRDVNPTPANKTFYIYTKLEYDEASYYISESKLPETSFNLWIGTIVTGATQITTITTTNVFTIGGHRISETKRGNSIPATSGSIRATGQLPWLRSSEL